jgi:putative nucleotidyltransferase with HDIG domain
MSWTIKRYVAVVVTLALAAGVQAYVHTTNPSKSDIQAALCFAAVGLLAHLLAYSKVGGGGGSISFLPCLTAILLAPNWFTVLAVASSMGLAEIWARRTPIKSAFNVAQMGLATSSSVLAFNALGGSALALSSDFSVDSPHRLLTYAIAASTFLGVNTLAVSIAIAISENRNVAEVWRKTASVNFVYDLLALPFVYLFAKVFLAFGWVGVGFMTIPLLGVRQLYKTNSQLEKTNQELLELMVAAIEARDVYTSGHSRRVSRAAQLIAKALGLGRADIERIGRAALLHDVGKIHEVYAPILRKPSRLTPEERAVMETHPIKSAELVEKVSYLRELVPMIRHHHENWNGTGYPDRIERSAIPLGSRIIMVADTIDAMTTDRPYRKALDKAAVQAELTRFAGSQFDPEIVERFIHTPEFHELFESPGTDLSYRMSLNALRRRSRPRGVSSSL